jgi:carboxyl-terminal processing protease
VYQTIRAEYVEDTNARQLFEGAMQGMLAALNDPYTRFLDKEQYAEFREE